MNDNISSANGQAASTDALTFLHWLYGADASGWLSIWTLPDKATGWYPAHRLPLAVKYALSRATTDEVYFGLGLRHEQLETGRGESSDVLGIPGFWIEIDIKHAVHTKVNLPETIEQAIALVDEAIPLNPSLIIRSGYGIHVYWLFRELWIFEDKDDRQRAYHLLHRLQATIQGVAKLHGWEVDSTFDLARVLRMPGTFNRKIPDNPQLVEIIESHEDRRYNPSDFLEHLIEVDETSYQQNASEVYAGELPPIEINTLKIHPRLKTLIKFGEDINAAKPYPSRSEALFDAVKWLLKVGIDEPTIMSLALDSRYAISEKPREKGQKWLASEIVRARTKLNGHRPIATRALEPDTLDPQDDERNVSANSDIQDELPQSTPSQALSGVEVRADGYYRKRIIKESPIYTKISSFLVRPTLRIWIDGSEAVRAETCTGKQTLGEVTIERHCWHSRGAFLKVLPSLDQWCIATDNEIQAIQAMVAMHKVPSKHGTRTLGLVDDVWVSEEGIFDVSGWIQDPNMIYLPPGGESPLAGHLRYRVHDPSDRFLVARAAYEQVWKLNELTVIGGLIGWFFATPFKLQIHAQLNHFPVLNIWGTMGAGKTSLLRLFWKLFGVDSELLSCTDTPFSLLSLLSATSSIPLVFDEFKPYDMKPDQVRQFERILRRVYDGDTEHRGRPDLRLITYRLMAPVAVAGEVSVARQPAMRERIIPVSPSKTWLPEHEEARKAYGEMVKLPLHAFASLYIEWSLRQDFASGWASADKALAESINRDIPERIRDGLRVVSFGLHQFEQFGLEYGLSIPEQLDLSSIFKGILDQLVSADGRSRVGLDVLLEHLAAMAEMGRLIEGQHYVARKVDSYLALRLDACLAEYRRYAKDTVSDDEVLSKESYLRQLRENHASKGYVVEVSGRTYFGKDQLRAVLISREQAEASGIDLDGFTRDHE